MFTLHCLVDDNTSESGSFLTEHGLAIAIETPSGQILFDTGPSSSVLIHNAAQSGIDLLKTKAVVLSHAHYDHTGGLEVFLQNSQPGRQLYAHPDLLRKRYSVKTGLVRSIGMCMEYADLNRFMNLKMSAEPTEVLPGVWTTGEIRERKEFEGRSPHHFIQSGDGWVPDPYRDDMALMLEAKFGTIVICGCCHAGLWNTIAHVQRISSKRIIGIVGGVHLAKADEHTLKHTITIFRENYGPDIPSLFLNHCTGEAALTTLMDSFGKKVNTFPAGKTLFFE